MTKSHRKNGLFAFSAMLTEMDPGKYGATTGKQHNQSCDLYTLFVSMSSTIRMLRCCLPVLNFASHPAHMFRDSTTQHIYLYEFYFFSPCWIWVLESIVAYGVDADASIFIFCILTTSSSLSQRQCFERVKFKFRPKINFKMMSLRKKNSWRPAMFFFLAFFFCFPHFAINVFNLAVLVFAVFLPSSSCFAHFNSGR